MLHLNELLLNLSEKDKLLDPSANPPGSSQMYPSTSYTKYPCHSTNS